MGFPDVSTQVFTDHESDLNEFTAKTPLSRNLRMNSRWEWRPAEAWQSQVNDTGGVLRGKYVLLFIHQQPAHCLHDYLFSAFAIVPTGRKSDAYLTRQHPDLPYDVQQSWCSFLFDRAGVIKAERNAPFKFSKLHGCYERLWVIRYGVGRYAPDWSRVNQSDHLPLYAHDEAKGQFPLRHLQNLHKTLLCKDDKVTMMCKPSLPKEKRVNVLVMDRSDARRRVWTNANEFVSLLVKRWSELSTLRLGSVQFFGTKWRELTPLEQARLFYHADALTGRSYPTSSSGRKNELF